MKNLISLSTAVFLLFAFTTTGLAQQKIAHIDSDAIVTLMPEYNQAKSNVETLSNVLKKDLEAQQKNIQNFVAAVKKDEPNLSPIQLQAKEQELAKMQQDLQIAAQKADIKLSEKEQELTKPIYDKFSATLEKVAQANGFAYILDIKLALYSKGGIDATELVKAELGL